MHVGVLRVAAAGKGAVGLASPCRGIGAWEDSSLCIGGAVLQSDVVQILSDLGFHFMVMAVGVFAIVGPLLAASGKTYRKPRILVLALVFYTFSAIAGYLFEGLLVSALYADKFDPFDLMIILVGFGQLMLFLTASCFLVWFYAANIHVNERSCSHGTKESGSEDH